MKKGRARDFLERCEGLRGIVAIVTPIKREYPKCREGMAANLLVKRLSVQILPSPSGPWTVSTNLLLVRN